MMMMRLTTVALTFLLSRGTMVTATIRYYPKDNNSDGSNTKAAGNSSNNLRGVRSSLNDHAVTQDSEHAATTTTTPQQHHELTVEEQELLLAADEATANYYLQGIRSEPLVPQHYQSLARSQQLHSTSSSSFSTPPQNQIQSKQQEETSSSSTKPKIRHKSSTTTKTKSQNTAALQTFAKNMLTNQGCPPAPHSTCGDICYVLTPEAATDLHSVVATSSSSQTTHTKHHYPTHHWHNPTTFWTTGVCNAKSQCISVNPFDREHDFHELQRTLDEVERECERRVGMGTLFVLAKAMEPPPDVAWLLRNDVERSVVED